MVILLNNQRQLINNRYITGGAAAPYRVKDDRRSSARIGNFRPLPIQQLLSDRLENVQQWYVRTPTNTAKFGQNRVGGGAPTWGWNIQLVWLFFILGLAPRSNAATDYFAKYVKMRGLAQGCAFWGSRIHEIKILGVMPQNPKNYHPE